MEKWSRRLALPAMALALAVAALVLPETASRATSETVMFAVQPTTTQVNTAMTPTVTVQVEQSGEEEGQAYNGPVTLTYAVNQIGAPEPSGNTVNAVNGVATFSGLTFGAVGFGFELRASIYDGTTSAPSAPFDIVTQLVQCTAGKSCQSKTVSSNGTSGSVTAAATQSSDVLTATGGGFPLLSCTKYGGVVSFSVQDRSKVITVTLDKSLVQLARPDGASDFNICWGSPAPFTTLNGKTSVFNPANNEYEGLLPVCCPKNGPLPCVQHRNKTRAGDEEITIDAPLGDPHITY